ncbi:hypothetical protein GCM10010172_06380 [Paractinoplanes ferrugineus]|uniref:Lipoprotein n=1 Tax=Paractinoplanes ferrugineus TaxID=113564 RepID=A0A919J0X6_9ACTN|nr:hypothetical protein [Actinoplanes ferrugineus]GIE12445.1 hypothetical protein Afe05nite_42850 [Actinoplanes ferrugineus]
MKQWIIVLCGGVTLLGTGGCAGADAGAAPAAPKATTLPGSADQQCLVAGSPWKASNPDLEASYREAVRGLDAKQVRVEGDQTLTVTQDLNVTILDETSARISGRTSNGADVVVTRRHTGSAGGQWKVSGRTLQPTGTWTGGIDVDTSATVDGHDRDSPVKMPADTFGTNTLTYSCTAGTLKLTAKGSSFAWLFN